MTASAAARGTSPFVGRDRDLGDLRAGLDDAAGGRGGLAFVAGEAGIGKTRLVEEVARLAADVGFAVVGVTCRGGEGAPPFWPWARVLRDLDVDPSVDARLAPLLGGASDDAPASVADAEAARWELFDAVTRVFSDIGVDRPLLITIDDLHWADGASLLLLERLAPDLRRTRVLIVAAYRHTDVTHALSATVAELGSHARHVELTGLGRDALATLVRATADAEPSDILLGALEHQTQGNPLFTREIVRLLVAQGRFERDDAASTPALPPTVRSVLERRLARLPGEAYEQLVTAAVIGAEFRLDELVATGRDRGDVLGRLQPAVDARLVAELPDRVGGYRFSHPLVRQVVYDGLSLDQRAREHRRVADALTALSAPVAEVAHHFVQGAGSDEMDTAVELCVRAGEEAAGALAYEDASEHYRQAIALLPASDPRRAELLLRAGEFDMRMGALARARSVFLDAAEAARAAGDGPQLARAALGLGTGFGGFEIELKSQAQIDLLEDALRMLDDGDSVLRAWVTARLSVALTHVDETRRGHLAEAGVAMARRLDEPRVLAYALAAHCDVISAPEHTDARVAQSGEIVELAQAAADRELELLGRRMRLVAFLERGDVAATDAEIDAFARIADTLRQPLYQWYVPMWRGMRALMSGDYERWRRLLDDTARIGEETSSDNARMMAFTQRMAFAVFGDGDFSHVARETEELMEAYPDLLSYASVLAEMYARTGREDQAQALLDSLFTSEMRNIPRDSEWLSSVFIATDVSVLLRHHDLAGVAYQQLLPFAGRVIVDGIGGSCLGAVDLCLGRLAALTGPIEDARRHFDDALALHRAMGAALLVEATERFRDSELAAERADTPSSSAVFRRDGDLWALGYDGKSVGMKDAKGLRDLATLLAAPGRSFHVTELLSATEGQPQPRAAGADAVLDRRAVDEYRRRLRDLEEEVDSAEDDHDLERAARAKAERDAIVGELERALGLGGRSRRLGDETERARKAVRARIRLTLDRLDAEHPALARHLRASVKTGAFCSYEPERPTEWQT